MCLHVCVYLCVYLFVCGRNAADCMWAFRFRTETRHDLSFLVGMYCKGFKFLCRGNVAFAIKLSLFCLDALPDEIGSLRKNVDLKKLE